MLYRCPVISHSTLWYPHPQSCHRGNKSAKGAKLPMANLKEEVFSMGFSVHEWRFFFCSHSFFSHGWDNPTEWGHTNWDDPPSSALVRKGQKGEPCLSWSRKHRGDFMHQEKIWGNGTRPRKLCCQPAKQWSSWFLGSNLLNLCVVA